MIPEERYQSAFLHVDCSLNSSCCRGGKIPLETAGFSRTLFNLPETFVRELKGLSGRIPL